VHREEEKLLSRRELLGRAGSVTVGALVVGPGSAYASPAASQDIGGGLTRARADAFAAVCAALRANTSRAAARSLLKATWRDLDDDGRWRLGVAIDGIDEGVSVRIANRSHAAVVRTLASWGRVDPRFGNAELIRLPSGPAAVEVLAAARPAAPAIDAAAGLRLHCAIEAVRPVGGESLVGSYP
jgi:hypothetical protein